MIPCVMEEDATGVATPPEPVHDQDDDDDLATKMRRLESEWREMVIEWESMYEKFRNLYGRLNKREERERPREAEKPINPAAAALLGWRKPE